MNEQERVQLALLVSLFFSGSCSYFFHVSTVVVCVGFDLPIPNTTTIPLNILQLIHGLIHQMMMESARSENVTSPCAGALLTEVH